MFLWGEGGGEWDTICLKKEVGGLGGRIIKDFNVALLGKWCWRMREEKDMLWYRVLVARCEKLEVGLLLVEGKTQFDGRIFPALALRMV